MKLNKIKSPQLNQNGYHTNIFSSKNNIGELEIYPISYTPKGSLPCDGYLLKIEDYKDLYKIIGRKFCQDGDSNNEFRIPDYNISGRFLQPNSNAGNIVAAGLPDITGVKPDWIGNTGFYGAFYYTSTNSHGTANSPLSNPSGQGTGFQASRSNPIYGNSTTVQPPSQTVHICIKYE